MTFDGVTLTNGFHPLWMICLLPVYAVAGNNLELAMRLALTLAALFSIGAVLLLGAAVRKWTQNALCGALASALFAINPYAILEGVNGLETALSLLMLSVVLLILSNWRISLSSTVFSRLPALLLGFSSGLLILSRSDMVLVLGALYLYLFLSRRAHWRVLVLAGSVCLLLIAVWLAWSWKTVGMPLQSSAVAIPWLTHLRMDHAIAIGQMTRGQAIDRIWQHFVQVTLYQMLKYAGIGLLAGLIGLIFRVKKRIQISYLPGWLGWGAAATVMMLLLSEFVRLSLREWYMAPLSLWAAVFGAGSLARWVDIRYMWKRLLVLLFVVVLLSGGQIWRDLRQPGRYWFQSDQLAAARWITAHTPPDAVIGSWTAGIYGYFSHRQVINLDGVVNWDAIAAYRACRLYDYMYTKQVSWVVDFDQFVGDFTYLFGINPVDFLIPRKTFEMADGPFGDLVVYEFKR